MYHPFYLFQQADWIVSPVLQVSSLSLQLFATLDIGNAMETTGASSAATASGSASGANTMTSMNTDASGRLHPRWLL